MAQKIHISRFTPSLMEPETLEAIFVQRERLATDTLERICESALYDNKHYMLFIGPRGCGKTHFVSLIYHRVKVLHELDDKLRVAWLNEDKTSTSMLDLNRRIYERLSQDYPNEFPAELLQTIYELSPAEATKYLKKLINDRLADKSALVIIENLDALFDALKTQGQHEWRSFLQESGKFCLLATAQQLFPGVSDRNLPFYGSFQTTYFKPLDVQDGTELLRNIAQQQQDHELVDFLQTPEGHSRVRALHHLSGGNHRVYVVFSEFINRQSLDELVTPFEKMLDELTPYYQERLRWLTPQQRMIVEHLCTCDRALPVKEIARALFATSQTVSKQLKDLKEKRYVRSAQRGRESLYELTEPLMRLSMELKENRGEPIRLVVDFLRVWYSREELDNKLQTLDDTARLERKYLESAIHLIDLGEEDPRIRALVEELDKLIVQGNEDEISKVAEEIYPVVSGSANLHKVTKQFREKLENASSLKINTPYAPNGLPIKVYMLMLEGGLDPNEQVPLSTIGTEITPETKLDDTDLRGLAMAGNYRPRKILSTVPLQWPTIGNHSIDNFDEDTFVCSMIRSISLTADEKKRVLDAIPRLSQEQIDELLEIFSEEVEAWDNFPAKWLIDIRELELKRARDWCGWLIENLDSTEAKQWLDEHVNDELADLLLVVKNPIGYEFSTQQRFRHLLNVVSWYVKHDEPENAGKWIIKIREFIAGLDEKSVQIDLLVHLSSQVRDWKQPEIALDIIHSALEITDKNASAYAEHSYILSNMGRDEEALAALDKAIELEPGNENRKVAHGIILGSLQRHEEAFSQFDQVLEKKPNHVYALQRKAIIFRDLKRFDESLTTIDKAIEHAGQQSDLWGTRGLILKAAGRLTEAAESYTKGIKLDPNDADCYNNMAVTYYTMGKYEEALESVNKSLRLRSDDPHTNFTRSEILLSSGKWYEGWQEAKECLQRFPPQTVSTGVEIYFIRIILNSTQQQNLWIERIVKLCELYNGVNALNYLGEGLVRSLKLTEIEQAASDLLDRWQSAWHQIGDQYNELSLSLRLFDVGIEYLKTREPNALLGLPIEQRAILEQLFNANITYDE